MSLWYSNSHLVLLSSELRLAMPVADCDCEKCELERQEAAESKPSEPTPIPIKLIYDKPQPAKAQPTAGKGIDKKAERSDYFYSAWESFLSVQSNAQREARTMSHSLKRRSRRSRGSSLVA